MKSGLTKFYLVRRPQLLVLGAVAVFALIVANVAWLFPTLEELETNAYLLHRAWSLDALNQIQTFLARNERAIENASDIINQNPEAANTVVARLMKENQPFESVSLLDLEGREVFKNHRFHLITPEDLRDFSSEELFAAIKNRSVYRGEVLVSGVSEPLITVALPLSKNINFSAIVVEINLKFLSEVVRNIPVTSGAQAYVIDNEGYIIAHPNSSLVFGRVNVLERKIIQKTLEGEEADTRTEEFIYKNEKGDEVFAVALKFDLVKWVVVAESPRNHALRASFRIINVALISFGLEVLLIGLLVWNYFNLLKAARLFYAERNQREAILNSLADGVIEYDQGLRIVLMNPKAEELLGVKLSEIQGVQITPELAKNKSHLQGVVELMYPALAPFASAIKTIPGSSSKIMELHLSNPELKLVVTLTHVVDRDGTIIGFLKILHDISREHFITRLKSEFVSIAAHQLRTPLSAVKWVLRVLLEGDVGALPDEQKGLIEKGYQANERMIKLVNDLLSAARIEEGRFGYEFKDINLVEFLEHIVGEYRLEGETKKLKLYFEKPREKIPLLHADPERLSIAVQNLLDNAVNYTLPGGEILVSINLKGEFVEVGIKDSGVGIPEAEQRRVFSKFFRASNVIRLETEGTGLGLFITRNIIKRHGGDVYFTSKEGGGTTFNFTLPLKREYIPPKEERPELEGFLGGI